MAHSDALPIVERLIGEIDAYLIHKDDGLSRVMADTNADTWGLEEHTNLRAWFEGKGKIRFSFDATFCGDQNPDRAFCGTTIKAQVEGEIVDKNDKWEIVKCKTSGAKLTDL